LFLNNLVADSDSQDNNSQKAYNIEELIKELEALKLKNSLIIKLTDSIKVEQRIQRELIRVDLERAKDTLEFSNTVVDWSGWMLSILGIGFIIIGFLGFREIKIIKKLREDFENEIANINEKEKIISELLFEIEKSKEELYKIISWNSDGIRAYFSGNYGKAIDLFEKIMKKRPKDYEVRIKLAKAYSSFGNFDSATKEYENAIKIEPENPVAYFGKGWNLRGKIFINDWDKNILEINKKEYEDAIIAYKCGLEKNKNDYQGRCGLGHLYLIINDFENAKDNFIKSLKLKYNSGAAFQLANLYLSKCTEINDEITRYYENAIIFAENELIEDSENYWSYYNRTCALIGLNKSKDAQNALKLALSKNSGIEILKIVFFHLNYMRNFNPEFRNIDKFISDIRRKIKESMQNEK